MKKFRWILILVLLAGFFAIGYFLGKGNAYWNRIKSEIFVSLLITDRKDALTNQGKVYINQLIDMNVHGFLMTDGQNAVGCYRIDAQLIFSGLMLQSEGLEFL